MLASALCNLAREECSVVRGEHTPKPVTRTVISSSWFGGSSGFEPMIRDVSRAKDEVERQCCGGGVESRGGDGD